MPLRPDGSFGLALTDPSLAPARPRWLKSGGAGAPEMIYVFLGGALITIGGLITTLAGGVMWAAGERDGPLVTGVGGGVAGLGLVLAATGWLVYWANFD